MFTFVTLPGLQILQVLCQKERIVCDDVAKAGFIHTNVFKKQQFWSHICAEIELHQHGTHIGPLLEFPQIDTCIKRTIVTV